MGAASESAIFFKRGKLRIKFRQLLLLQPKQPQRAKSRGIQNIRILCNGDQFGVPGSMLSPLDLYLFQNGSIVLETDFVSGNMSKAGCMTPPGVFGLTYKTKNAVLRGADYETPVNYWMPFNGNVGMHDATWRGSFGGTIYLTSGSHGCVNLPLNMAAAIYEYVSTGFPVVCYYY